MNISEYNYLCKSLAKAISVGVRLYRGKESLYYYSTFHLEPDPILPYLTEIIENNQTAGIITTSLFQFYGYFTSLDGFRIIIGPSGVLTEDRKEMNTLMFLLDVPELERAEYSKKLNCAPSITVERMGWILAFLGTVISHKPFYIEDIFVSTKAENHQRVVAENSALETLRVADDDESTEMARGSYHYEKMMLSYVENGQVEQLQELLSATPQFKVGEMAQDTLRQIKNMGICGATVASRAAIVGGMDSQTAFRISDIYIQNIEMLHDYASIFRLMNDMMIEFAQRVKLVKYCGGVNSSLFKKCVQYVSQNLSRNIKVEDMASEFGMARTYLCNRFKQLTGTTLSQYILNEKIIEAQRLLQFTDKSLSEIAMHLSFSSQSHFQTVFKKITEKTPMEFRRNHV